MSVRVAAARSPGLPKTRSSQAKQGGHCRLQYARLYRSPHAQVTVTFDKPYYTEVQLSVRGHIRTDIVVNPSQVALGSVDFGQAAEKKINIEYAGRSDWKILEVKPSSPWITATVTETARTGGRVSYELAVSLSPDAPVGYVRDQLQITTNDRRATQFPVNVEGRVASELSVSPADVVLGLLQPGEEVTRQIVVKGKKPFRIVGIDCQSDAFSFHAGSEPKSVHVIPLTFTAGTRSRARSASRSRFAPTWTIAAST